MFDAIARALFGTAAPTPAFATAGAGSHSRVAAFTVQMPTTRTGGKRPREERTADTPLAWADYGRGF